LLLQVGDLFELNVKLRCQKVKQSVKSLFLTFTESDYVLQRPCEYCSTILIWKSQQDAHVTEFILSDDCSTAFSAEYTLSTTTVILT
jgi:hypothetical protein